MTRQKTLAAVWPSNKITTYSPEQSPFEKFRVLAAVAFINYAVGLHIL